MEQQALGFTLQQGVAVAVCIAVALSFGFAIVKLFQLSRSDSATQRQEFGAMLEKHGAHLDTLTDKLADNTHAIERLGDRIGARAA